MKSAFRLSLVALSMTAGVLALLLTVTFFSLAGAGADVDLGVHIGAPAHVAVGTAVEVNVAYSNTGTAASPEDTRLAVTLPLGVQFEAAFDGADAPLPPDETQGNTLIWRVGALPAGTCCRHIRITERVAPDLSEGVVLVHQTAISSSAAESNTSNNAEEAESTVCDMAGSSKRVHAPEVMPGEVLTYTIQLRLAHRQGRTAPEERGVTFEDTLPGDKVRFLGWTGELSGTQEGQTLQWQGRVRASEPLQLQYRVRVEDTVEPGSVITNGARLSWGSGQMSLGPATTVVTGSVNAHDFGPNGGTWRHTYGVSLVVPPGAVTDTTRFQFRPMITDTQTITPPVGWRFAHRAYEVTAFGGGQSVHRFGQPVTMTVEYTEPDSAGMARNTLRLWYRQGEGEPWAMLGDPAGATTGTLSFTTDHLTQFALFGQPAHAVHLPWLSTVRPD